MGLMAVALHLQQVSMHWVKRGVRLDGAAVGVIIVYLPDHENRTVQRLYHHNSGYMIGEIIEFANQMNRILSMRRSLINHLINYQFIKNY